MKRLYLFVSLCLTVFLASCKKTDDNSIFYTADEIYLISDDDEEKIRNTIEGNIVCLTLNELIGGDAPVK